jgi:thiamine kinase-like enzyme
MILTKHNLIHYLLDKNLLDMESVMQGEYTVRNNDSRNCNLQVNKEYNKSNYFVKQIRATEAEKIDTLRTEAACYMLTHKKGSTIALKEFLPKFYLFDRRNHILITEQIKDVINLHEYYFTHFNFINTIPEKLANILASLHKPEVIQSIQQQPEEDKIKFRNIKPWVFSIAERPVEYWASQAPSAEQQAMLLILKNPDFCRLLNAVNSLWQPNALVHHDVKFTNFLVPLHAENQAIESVKLIDWELADYGDAAWDIACMVQSYLHVWASTDIPDQELQAQGSIQKVSLTQVQLCIQQFWKQYVVQAHIPLPQQYTLLLKVVNFTALKLIHTCFEATPYMQTLQPNAVKLLQIAYNILKSPENASVHLLGIK